jgi:two-component system, NarL family, sensor histidine kinase DesK
MGEVERLVRATLQEVREAVSRWRTRGLAGELRSAREILAAAGIEYHEEMDDRALKDLPAACEEVLAWAVREGVTNIIRHSGAPLCTIRLSREQRALSLQIIDGEAGPAREEPEWRQESRDSQQGEARPLPRGSGLEGIRERVATLGGQLKAGHTVQGGFAVFLGVPIHSAEGPRPRDGDGP